VPVSLEQGVDSMSGSARSQIAPEDLVRLVASAARAPSLHNSQPWRFRLRENSIELHSDPERIIQEVDPDGREMLISCGAALYGLRLGLRRLGFMPVADLVPDPAEPGLLACVTPGGRARPSRDELDLISALPHRHTHRGPFGPGRVPERLLAALVQDAAAEDAELVLLSALEAHELARLTATASRQQEASPQIRAEERSWARPPDSAARDGIPARALRQPGPTPPERPQRQEGPAHERLAQRDFGAPAGPADGALPSATAVLMTTGDTPADWLRAGQALHRLLLRAATRWVFASLHSQALESPRLRAGIRDALSLRGEPQMLLQFGRANTAAATPRRPVTDVIDTVRPVPGLL
jgi:nitroreductase